MKILLNGATGGTNFGDFLFAQIFHNSVSSIVGEDNVFWYDSKYCLSDFYKKYLKCNARKHKLKDIDALVCISGGYFCGGDKNIYFYLVRYLRYFHLCIRCILRKIPVAIIGVEVAKPKLKLMDWIQKFILKRAEIVIVRNEESLEHLRRYGVKNPICTADTAHVITADMFENRFVQDDIVDLQGKKLFFHVQPSCMNEARRLIPVINRFIKNHPEYAVVVGTDQYLEDNTCIHELCKNFSFSNFAVYRYEDPVVLCKVLNMMDLIVTPKLHVGIVGTTLSKSVVSFSVHTEKIARFYHQIGEDDRSLAMQNFSEDKALEMLEKYEGTCVCIKQEILEASKSNLAYLENFINTHRVNG